MLARRVTVSVVLAAIVAAAISSAANTILQNALAKVQRTDYISNNKFNESINAINGLAEFIEKTADASYLRWSDLFIGIAQAAPAGIRFQSIQTNQANTIVIFNGSADQRENLLQLQNNLEKSVFFTAVNIPIQSLAEKENISFIITATLNSAALRLQP